ncbi:MAG: hypothetical protein ACFFCB_03250 [Candidatus Odinarchaeota archaeon]
MVSTKKKLKRLRKKWDSMPTVERAVNACRNPTAPPRSKYAVTFLLTRR